MVHRLYRCWLLSLTIKLNLKLTVVVVEIWLGHAVALARES